MTVNEPTETIIWIPKSSVRRLSGDAIMTGLRFKLFFMEILNISYSYIYFICQSSGLSKEYIRDAAIRACEELEDWKEKQQQMFEFEVSINYENYFFEPDFNM